MHRNEVAVFDPSVVRQHAQAELRSKISPARHEVNQNVGPALELSHEAKARMASALQAELQKMSERAEIRRRRDPTYRPDALDIDRRKMLPFDRFVDYYEILNVARHASTAEVREAYKRQSLKLHPDKQQCSTEEESVAAKDKFHGLTQAYAILNEPATREAYDRARDRLEAQYEAGVVVATDATKPAPTCVDVSLTLEETFVGCIKYVRFKRTLFAGTKWEKKDEDVFTLKIRPGELPGTTFWFKDKGDVSTEGKSDLVFVIREEPHATFERVGADLWFRVEDPAPVDALFLAALVPTMQVERNWLGPIKGSKGASGFAIAATNCLSAALGFDRSGWAEAVVRGEGMPLLADGEDVRRGTGAVDEREQGSDLKQTASEKLVKQATAEQAARGPVQRGDLIVKFRLQPVAGSVKRRVWLPDGALQQPPVVLLTTVAHFDDGAAADGADRGPRPRRLPPSATHTLVVQTLLPHMLLRAMRRVAREGASADLGLSAVCLRLGGGAEDSPSAGARQLIARMSQAMPALRWQVVRATEGVACPLLPDEEEEVKRAAIVLVEAVTDSEMRPRPMVWDFGKGALVPEQLKPTLCEASLSELGGRVSASGTEMRVGWRPGVRVRSAPSLDAPAIGFRRFGSFLRCSLPDRHGWVQLDENDAADPGGWVHTGGSSSGDGRGIDGGGGASTADNGRRSRVSAQRWLQVVRPASDLDGDLSEEEEVSHEEKRSAQAKAERAYLEGGVGAARALSHHPTLRALFASHCAGGVLVAIDHACTLLGKSALPASAAISPVETSAESPNAGETAGGRETHAGLQILPYIVGLAPIEPLVAPAAAQQEDRAPVQSAAGESIAGPADTGEACRVLKGKQPRLSFRRLRGAVAHGQVADSPLGFAALGLPPGCVLTLESARTFRPWPVLGSLQPVRISRTSALEREARVRAAQRKRRIERERHQTLEAIATAFRAVSLSWPPPQSQCEGGHADWQGVRRGQCPECNACPGYEAPPLPHEPNLLNLCCHCGCACGAHEVLRQAEVADYGNVQTRAP